MNFTFGHYEDDLRVSYCDINENYNSHISHTRHNYVATSTYLSYYKMLYTIDGQLKVSMGDKTYKNEPPLLMIAAPNLKFNYSFFIKKPLRYLLIEVHPSLFADIIDKGDFLRSFNNLSGEDLFYDLKKPENEGLVYILNSISMALFAYYGRCHMETRIKTLVSELCLIYDTKHSEYIPSTDSVAVQIMDYIRKNYLEDISYKTITDKFFVSVPTINAVVKKHTGKTFWRLVTDARLATAQNMLKSGNHTAAAVASLSGFANYSTFFQAYKKRYGVAPSTATKKKSEYWPLKK